MVNETNYLDIGAYILEHHTSQLTKDSIEINAIHDPMFQIVSYRISVDWL